MPFCSFSRRLSTLSQIVPVCLLLAACGFSPLYGEKSSSNPYDSGVSSVGAALDQVYINNIPDRDGQYLRNALTDRFYSSGYPSQPRYVLSVVNMHETLTDLDLTKSASATRAQLRLVATIRLRDRETGQEVLNQSLTSMTSYNILPSQFNTRVTEQNARENALDDMARQIEMRLALYFKRL